MSEHRLFWFGLACFVAGWLAAGALEFWRMPPVIGAMVLMVALVIIAHAAGAVARRRGR